MSPDIAELKEKTDLEFADLHQLLAANQALIDEAGLKGDMELFKVEARLCNFFGCKFARVGVAGIAV